MLNAVHEVGPAPTDCHLHAHAQLVADARRHLAAARASDRPSISTTALLMLYSTVQYS